MVWTFPISANAPATNAPLAFDGTNIVAAPGLLKIFASGVLTIPSGTTIPANSFNTFDQAVPGILITDAVITTAQFISGFGALSMFTIMDSASPTGFLLAVQNLSSTSFSLGLGASINWMILRSS